MSRVGCGVALGLGGAAAWTPADWLGRLEDWTADDVLTSGTAVTAFVSQCGGHNAAQANASYQGVLGTGANGHPVVAVTAPAYQWYSFTSPTSTDGDLALCAVMLAPNRVTTYQATLDIGKTGGGQRKIFRHNSATATDVQLFDGATARGLGANTDALQSLIVDANATGNASTQWRSGTSIGTAACGGTAVVGGSGRLFADADGETLYHIQGDNAIYRVTLLDRAVTAGDRTSWFEWSLGRYGV